MKDIHDYLLAIVLRRDEDYFPYGKRERDCLDCSCGCKWYVSVLWVGDTWVGDDWGACINQKSHRCGLLTFEHQGCSFFEAWENESNNA